MVQNFIGVTAAALSVAASLLTAIGIGTRSWTTQSFFSQWAHYGLFRYCTGNGDNEQCSSAIATDTSFQVCNSRTAGDWNNYYRAMQGFAACTMILAGLLSFVSILQALGKWRGTSTIPALLVCVLGFLSSILLIILWAIFTGSYAFCGTSVCDRACGGIAGCSCGMGFSFYMVLIASLLFGVTGVVQFVLRRQFSSGYSAVEEHHNLVAANAI